MPHDVLALIGLSGPMRTALESRFRLHLYEQGPDTMDWAEPGLSDTVAVLTNGTVGCAPALMDRMPRLKLIMAIGAGYENIDVAAAAQRGVTVTHGPGTNSVSVAEHAVGFALSLARGYAPLHQALRGGTPWMDLRASRPAFSGSRVGILGMGQIGQLVAARAAAFGASIAYHSPRRKPEVESAFQASYHPDVISLAAASDFLFACCPGGPATRHLLSKPAFDALGPKGFVINVARGSVLKTADLLDALRSGTIAGAGLDVLEEEPSPSPELLAELTSYPNVLITPHMSGRSPASVLAQRDVVVQAIEAILAGQAPAYRVTA